MKVRNNKTEEYDVPTLSYCTSADELYFVIAIFVYKGALLIFGIFLAWSTRNVRISQLNDSKCECGRGQTEQFEAITLLHVFELEHSFDKENLPTTFYRPYQLSFKRPLDQSGWLIEN